MGKMVGRELGVRSQNSGVGIQQGKDRALPFWILNSGFFYKSPLIVAES